jgi:hypothetical protein
MFIMSFRNKINKIWYGVLAQQILKQIVGNKTKINATASSTDTGITKSDRNPLG